MERILLLVFILYSLVASPMPASAGSQTWLVRPGDNLEIIATTLEISKEDIKRQNSNLSEGNLQIGQKLKLPLRPYPESKALEEQLGKKAVQIGELETTISDLEKQIASAHSRLAWYPVWLWGFWICFSIIAFIACGAYWIFRQTHPQVFDHPHDRSIRDLRESQIRARSSFAYEDGGATSRLSLTAAHYRSASAHR